MARSISISIARAQGWRRNARRLMTVAALAAGGLMASGVGLGFYVAATLTHPRRPSPTDEYIMTPFETGIPYEEVRFPSPDATHDVCGWWMAHPETTRVIVCCAGYRGSKSELIGIGAALWRAGFNVLLFDYFGHGADRGQPVTLAYREVRDFFAALDYVRARMPNARIGVIGFSMGASIAIMGAARRPEVRAVVADSAFATHAAVVTHNVERVIRVSGRPVTAISDYFLEWLAGYRGRDVAPVRDVAALAPRPLLLFHGTADEIIPVTHAHQIYAAAGEPKELVLAEGAGHCGAYFQDRPGYCERVARFFERALAEPLADAAEPPVSVRRAARREDGPPPGPLSLRSAAAPCRWAALLAANAARAAALAQGAARGNLTPARRRHPSPTGRGGI